MIAIVRLLLVTLAWELLVVQLFAQVEHGAYFIPGDPKAGMQIFVSKGCVRCHSVLGEGGHTAPDLARAPAGHLSATELVAAMWNHAPSMWQKMRFERVKPPKFSDDEMTDLFAFLYSVRSLDEPGDPERGRRLLSEKKCLDCHAVSGQGGRLGPNLTNWTSYRNAVSWIQAMWNHGSSMQRLMAERGMSWPEFGGTDMADLIAYIRTLATSPKKLVLLRLSNPEAGKRLYEAKGCAACHPFRGAGARRAPDLGASLLPRTLGQFAALMWNHAPAMWRSMQVQQVARPEFSSQEMADLISYLFTERYFEAAGDAGSGKRAFEEKGCAGCHSSSSGKSNAPDLAGWRGATSSIRLAAALWNHGPLMHEAMQQRQIQWPRFRPGEIVDLMEYLGRQQFSQQYTGGKR
jgi:cytochrome c2